MSEPIPADVLLGIDTKAKDEWPDNREMQDYTIEAEKAAYLKLQKIDYGQALSHRQTILRHAAELWDDWGDRVQFVEEEICAYDELEGLCADDLPIEVLQAIRLRAKEDGAYFTNQLEIIEAGIAHHRYVEATRAKVAPVRELLEEMERIIGNECYNGNIQNYGGWGVWEGEGRSFRYPLTFVRKGAEEKRRVRTDDLQPEELLTGYYKFGANELSIYRGLLKVIDLLEDKYDFQAPRRTPDS